ncbi:MAG: DUF3604 domain-containing protein [Bryobacterales bacterium]|nr:DUF3604 domain-containing protein [Bryobacterales bacterium]
MNRRRSALALSLSVVAMLLMGSGLAAQQKKRANRAKKSEVNPEGPVDAGQRAAWAGTIGGTAAGSAGKQSDFPAIAVTRDGALWIAFVEWNDKDADRVLVRRRDGQGKWGEAIELADGNWDHYSPTLAARGDSVAAIWSGQSNGNFDLYWSQIGPEGKASKPAPLSRAPHSDINARAVSDGQGNVTVVWQSFRAGNSDIYARRLSGNTWSAEVALTTWPSNEWEPAVALDEKGMAWVSFDSYKNGNYDVFLAAFDGRKPGAVTAVTTEPGAQFHSSVAVDREGRAWVAWDDGGVNWGKDYSRSSAVEGSRGLHFSRGLGLRVVSAGAVQEVSPAVSGKFSGRMLRYAELPHLAFDGSGSLVLVFRHWTETRPREIFHFYVTRLSGGEWQQPYQIASSAGHNSQQASLARLPGGGIAIGYASDGRTPEVVPTDVLHALHYNAYVSEWGNGGGAAKAELRAAQLPAAGAPAARRVRATMSVAGKRYTLLLGDCHRHTDIRGHSGVDASVLDTYRYALDAAQLDFLGTSDHNVVDPKWTDGLRDYQWWYTQKAVDLFTHDPVFTGIYSYEHSMQRPGGHRNVLFLKRGAPLRPIDRSSKTGDDNLPPAMWKWWEANVLSQSGQKSVIVPHTFGAGPLADFNWPNARFDCLLEMYQGARGSYEAWRLPEKEKRGPTQVDEDGHFAQNALAKGNTYGFVSFSDHGSTHNSWAGVWVERVNREGVLDAMYARRTFAASDEITVKASAQGHMPGEEWSSKTPVQIEASIDAPDTILRIDVVKDGKYVYTTRPNARQAVLRWRDTAPKDGRSYYYLRVFQRDPENPEGDPEIAWSSPFYVNR